MKVVLWIGIGANQKALACKIHALFPINTIFIESPKSRTVKISEIFGKIFEKFFLSSISKAWFNMLNYYEVKYPEYPKTNIIVTDDINSDKNYDLTLKENPDLIIVSGTKLIRKKLLSLKPRIGIVNLHTGLSPYIKGGPNCTNWCISTNQLHLIGNTVMWIDEGIDSGNLIKTGLTEFSGDESLLEVHIKVMEHAHSLYIEVIKKLSKGVIVNVDQKEVGVGTTYYTRDWSLKRKIDLVKRFKNFKSTINSPDYKERQSLIKTVG